MLCLLFRRRIRAQRAASCQVSDGGTAAEPRGGRLPAERGAGMPLLCSSSEGVAGSGWHALERVHYCGVREEILLCSLALL